MRIYCTRTVDGTAAVATVGGVSEGLGVGSGETVVFTSAFFAAAESLS